MVCGVRGEIIRIGCVGQLSLAGSITPRNISRE